MSNLSTCASIWSRELLLAERKDCNMRSHGFSASQMGGQSEEVPMSISPDRLPDFQTRPSTGSAPGSRLGAFAIETQGLSKHYGKRIAVSGLTISIPTGTIAGFIGPNGAGKTTTIRLLLGLIRPDTGSATILGQPLTNPLGYLPRVGALIEAPAFYPGLSARA